MVVVGEVNAPGAALDGEGVSVQVREFAMPSFEMDAENDCVLPSVRTPGSDGGFSVIVVAGILKFTVAQTVGAAVAQACTTAFCEG